MVPSSPRRNDALPPVMKEKALKKKMKEKCFIDFCLCTADVEDWQKEVFISQCRPVKRSPHVMATAVSRGPLQLQIAEESEAPGTCGGRSVPHFNHFLGKQNSTVRADRSNQKLFWMRESVSRGSERRPRRSQTGRAGEQRVKGASDRLRALEVGEEILGTQMDDEGSDGPRLVEGIVDEKTPCSERKRRKRKSRSN
ncbi:hypothetical protein F2P81_015930 [Scophthalmus maximus]|uniref:Uncharacterized protein n=1 Tax=Scophthalmus maximus TaxID=52904 RepID=A0A6A4SFM4_SCOMX|nr:hypothetical protein F2P81_015930 [Scophthalmus maximus]